MYNFDLTDTELETLNGYLATVIGGTIPNAESLDGFLAALVCCPDLIMPSEYLQVIQSGSTAEGGIQFQSSDEAAEFMRLVMKHWNHVNDQLSGDDVYLPLLFEDEDGTAHGNDWANGFLEGTALRKEIWSEVINSEDYGGPFVPIWALAYEHHPDPKMRPYKEPMTPELREELIIQAAAGVMKLYDYFYDDRALYAPNTTPYARNSAKIGRNDPCPCGSGKKYKKCCGAIRIH